MSTMTYVRGAERMVVAASLVPEGLFVRFADDRRGVIPWHQLNLGAAPRAVDVPRPHLIVVHLEGGAVEEVPWDFARHFADATYMASSEAAGVQGRRTLGRRLAALRSERGVSQLALAEQAGINRVSIARIERGHQLPRYTTLIALAGALDVPMERLLTG